jgi:polynucleotide 5'-kinase involved in rRNA processing
MKQMVCTILGFNETVGYISRELAIELKIQKIIRIDADLVVHLTPKDLKKEDLCCVSQYHL